MTEKQPGKRGPKPVIDDEGRRYEGEPPREQNDGPRDEQYERRSRGGRAGARKRRDKQVDSYLPVRSYSPERVRPWDM